VHLDDGAGWDLTEAGTHKSLSVYVLTDQTAVAGIGNAYSDEILHTARLSPFALAATLDGGPTERLYAAIRTGGKPLADRRMSKFGIRQ
jgi:formamidopyrimidine-DNA glycosylase